MQHSSGQSNCQSSLYIKYIQRNIGFYHKPWQQSNSEVKASADPFLKLLLKPATVHMYICLSIHSHTLFSRYSVVSSKNEPIFTENRFSVWKLPYFEKCGISE